MDKVYSLLFVVAVVAVVGVSGCTSQNSSVNSSVIIQNMAFNPSTLTVPIGTTVTWKNLDNTTHHIVSNSGLFESGDLSNGQTFNYTFSKTGNYPYHDSLNPSITGTIVVTAAGTANNQQNSSNNSSGNKSNGNVTIKTNTSTSNIPITFNKSGG